MNGCEFIRVVTKDDEECFLLTKLFAKGKEGFELTVFNDGKVWSGKVTEDDLEELASRLKINYSKYVEQTTEALTSLGTAASQTFQYQLKQQRDTAEFSWKKHIAEENITFQLGSATLKSRPDSSQFITKMFKHCVLSMEELKERIRNLETDNERLSQERLNALKRLEKCVVAKEELEQELYSKFTMVLNSKKEKIRQLKQGVNNSMGNGAADDSDSDVDEPSTSTSRTKRSRSPEDVGNTVKSDSDRNTDDETPKAKKPRASQRAKDTKSRADDSLDLGNDEDAEEVTQVTRTRRQRGRQQKKQTPSKPVLPRVGSNESSLGSDKKPKLRKRGSSNSNKSSENVDADDLMGEL